MFKDYQDSISNPYFRFLQIQAQTGRKKYILKGLSLFQACFFTDFPAIQDNGISLILSLEEKSLSLGRKSLSLEKIQKFMAKILRFRRETGKFLT